MEDYGTVETSEGTLKIVKFLQGKFVDNRIATVAELEDGSFMLVIENIKSSGRNPQQTMRLTRDSFKAILMMLTMYADAVMEGTEELKAVIGGEEFSFSYSMSIEDKIKKYTS